MIKIFNLKVRKHINIKILSEKVYENMFEKSIYIYAD